MSGHFLQVADVANVIALAILIDILVDHLLTRDSRDHVEGFKD